MTPQLDCIFILYKKTTWRLRFFKKNVKCCFDAFGKYFCENVMLELKYCKILSTLKRFMHGKKKKRGTKVSSLGSGVKVKTKLNKLNRLPNSIRCIAKKCCYNK